MKYSYLRIKVAPGNIFHALFFKSTFHLSYVLSLDPNKPVVTAHKTDANFYTSCQLLFIVIIILDSDFPKHYNLICLLGGDRRVK